MNFCIFDTFITRIIQRPLSAITFNVASVIPGYNDWIIRVKLDEPFFCIVSINNMVAADGKLRSPIESKPEISLIIKKGKMFTLNNFKY